jgi:hypothetical protein
VRVRELQIRATPSSKMLGGLLLGHAGLVINTRLLSGLGQSEMEQWHSGRWTVEQEGQTGADTTMPGMGA